ncbi:unnamed protein product [Microthlaspi erraticum]|uniref:Uncharacterized protein n=1 Tax=Microthlaspi erraticum TaxID=1685480 RepID=A0A6D2J9A0_9BRAS|nr:unnamed protein product [Microthlaspi erraticum]
MSYPEKRKRRKKKEPSPTLPSTPNPASSSPKKKKLSPTPQTSPFLSLPYDLLLDCVARVSRLYHPTLSLVCKRFGSLLASPELYKARSLLGNTERCLYVCIGHGANESRWYTLCRKPDKILDNEDTKSKSSGYALARVPFPESPRADFVGLVVVGSSIYQIADWETLKSQFWIAGRYLSNLFHVFDTESQVWDALPPLPFTGNHHVKGTACIDGKFHTISTSKVDVAYSSTEGRWDLVRSGMSEYMSNNSYCVIENVLYSASYGDFRWYDSEAHKWRNLNGLVGLPKLRCEHGIRLADYGGNLVVSWNQQTYYSFLPQTKIWCAEVSLERRRESCEIWGKVEWLEHMLTAPRIIDVTKVLAVAV